MDNMDQILLFCAKFLSACHFLHSQIDNEEATELLEKSMAKSALEKLQVSL